MGAINFMTIARGKDASEAFNNAVEDAQYEYGHRGYTGTIAEKSSYTLVVPREGETPQQCLDRHVEKNTFFDKWGPAGCVQLEPGKFCFFGFAAS